MTDKTWYEIKLPIENDTQDVIGTIQLDKECPKCKSYKIDKNCQDCRGTGFVLTTEGEILLKWLTRHGFVE